jgi:DNA-binding LacI/PurR family transcriptional regulator
MKKSRPTIRDVAALAGVSYQTVSRVINQHPSVTDATREKIQEAIKILGYRPNAIARSMVKGQTMMLACVAPNLIDYTHASIIHAAEAEAKKHGYFLLASSAKNRESFVAQLDRLLFQRRVDGVIVLNPYITDLDSLIPQNTPSVFLVGDPKRVVGHDVVFFDNQGGAFLAAEHLLNLGHRHIATVLGPENEDSVRLRFRGFEQALSGQGIAPDPDWIFHGDWSATAGYSALRHWAEIGKLPTAVFAQNDRMAVGLIKAAQELDLRVPEDLSVFGFDDMPLASYFMPSLSTIRQDMRQLGQVAAELLIEKIKSPDTPIKQIQIESELVVRQSTCER